VSYVLCVDDNEDMRLMVREVLQSAGHETDLAADGLSALASIQEREPDLLVLDLVMPGMSGLDVCRAVKLNPFTARIPILMLTAQGDIAAKVAAFDAGADDYLAKPFDPRELRARIVALLRIVRREGDRNPTSGLPGGKAIEEEIERRAEKGDSFAICYIDLDNFKPFADTFGFSIADMVIRDMGQAIRGAIEMTGTPTDFVGHIGGDDFIAVTSVQRALSIARECALRFVDVAKRAVGEEAVRRGHFTGVDREGRARDFPIARLSAAVLQIGPDRWISTGHIGSLAAEVKRRAKQRGPGTILVQTV
jgi:PleD family two-component response regulator